MRLNFDTEILDEKDTKTISFFVQFKSRESFETQKINLDERILD